MIYECIGVYSQTAYSIPELSVSVHSFEELCHVIKENLYNLGDFIMKDELMAFIDRELSLHDLADRLKDMAPKLTDFVEAVLSYRHYMNEADIARIKDALSGENDVREYIRLISRGDFLTDNKKYRPAILMYEHARELMDKENERDAALYKGLMGKLGRLYALYFLFDKASECFSVAGDERRTFFCRKLSLPRARYVDMLLHERPDESLVAQVEEMTKKPREIEDLELGMRDGSAYGTELNTDRLAGRLKAEYRRLS